MTTSPEPVSITAWGELAGERKLPGVLRVLVGGQHARAVALEDDAWSAQVHGLRATRPGVHATAADAVAAILRSSWGRRLGVRTASPVHWSTRATRLANRGADGRADAARA